MRNVALVRRFSGYVLLLLASVSLALSFSSETPAAPPLLPSTSTTVSLPSKEGLMVKKDALSLVEHLPSLSDVERFSSLQWALAVDGPLPLRDLLRTPFPRSEVLVSQVMTGWVRAFKSGSQVVSVSVFRVSPQAKPVKAHPENLSVTLDPGDRSPDGLSLPWADWLSYAPGEVIMKRDGFVVWARSSSVSLDMLSSLASLTAQSASPVSEGRKDGSAKPPQGAPSPFDIPEILPLYPDRDTFFPTSSGLCVLFKDAWVLSPCANYPDN